jgi:hypothetical protein
MEIVLQHIRSFSTSQRIPLRPLTLLVGENSSGKSTFLAAVSTIFDASGFPFRPGFNEPPYNLGTFDTIATFKGGRYGRDKFFSLGFTVGQRGAQDYRESTATYASEAGEATLSRLHSESKWGVLDLTVAGSNLTGTLSWVPEDGRPSNRVEFGAEVPEAKAIGAAGLPSALVPAIFKKLAPRRLAAPGQPQLESGDIEAMMCVLEGAMPPYGSCYSYAPIRSKPRRTYDELSEDYSPEGDHVPTLLARLLQLGRRSAEGQRVHKALARFGQESGLFRTIDVRRLGSKATDPFQLQVAVSGPPANLADVGYGVSQALPIVVQSVVKSASKVLLMQQPEVHLHPRAQAALGTFFSELFRSGDRIALIETHSDYLVDRVRQEVATGSIPKERVLILFFHKAKLDTAIWPITLDNFGNVEGAPGEYRSFFLDEELKLLNRTS